MQTMISSYPSKIFKQTVIATLLLAVMPVSAVDLQEILRKSLVTDPMLLEAKANEDVARSTTKATRAGHYPTASLTGTQMLMQKTDDGDDDLTNGLGLRGTLNLYAWGGIQAAINRDKQNEAYYKFKFYETQGELGNTIGKLYLEALRAHESLIIYEQSLERHNKLLKDLTVVVTYDAGRRSEMIEAQAQRLQVQTMIANLRRTRDLALSSLAKYTGETLSPKDLQDPFRSETSNTILKKYRNLDNATHPSYLAQQAEREKTRYEIDVTKASQKPSINLESYVNRDTKQVYLNLSWNILDLAHRHKVDQNVYTLVAADTRMDQILREVTERSRSAEINMTQSEQRSQISSQHIVAQKEVVKAYELQFKIARRTLSDVLNSYDRLVSIEQEYVTARSDFRDAALAFLVAQARVPQWAGLEQDSLPDIKQPNLADNKAGVIETTQASSQADNPFKHTAASLSAKEGKPFSDGILAQGVQASSAPNISIPYATEEASKQATGKRAENLKDTSVVQPVMVKTTPVPYVNPYEGKVTPVTIATQTSNTKPLPEKIIPITQEVAIKATPVPYKNPYENQAIVSPKAIIPSSIDSPQMIKTPIVETTKVPYVNPYELQPINADSRKQAVRESSQQVAKIQPVIKATTVPYANPYDLQPINVEPKKQVTAKSASSEVKAQTPVQATKAPYVTSYEANAMTKSSKQIAATDTKAIPHKPIKTTSVPYVNPYELKPINTNSSTQSVTTKEMKTQTKSQTTAVKTTVVPYVNPYELKPINTASIVSGGISSSQEQVLQPIKTTAVPYVNPFEK